MPNLIPEKRLDRNGRLVTKHVKATPSATTPKASLPSPTVAPATKPKKTPAARTKQKVWDFYEYQTGADKELIKATKSYNQHLNYYFEASDVDAYEVMSVVAPRNIIPLLSTGIRKREDAKSFLEQKGLAHLIEDNASFAEKALSQNVPAQVAASMVKDFPDASADDPHYFDAMEAHGVKAYREAGSEYGKAICTQRVLDGTISLSDLKIVGASRMKAGGGGAAIMTQLGKINSGTANMTVEELAAVITHANSKPSQHSTMVNEAVWFADRHGAKLALELNDVVFAASFSNALIHNGYTGPLEDIFKWHDELRDGEWIGHVEAKDLIAMFEAGVQPSDVIEGVKRGRMTPQQIIAVHAEGISPVVSSGWL